MSKIGGRLAGRLTYANVIATLALFIAIGGGAYAVGLKKNSVKSKHIKDGAVVSADVGDGSITGADVANNALTGDDVDEASLSLPPADTGAQILDKLKGVDGAGSGLDADTLDGKQLDAWNVSEPIDGYGSGGFGVFSSSGGKLVISVSGTGYRSSTAAQQQGHIGMRVLVDSTEVDTTTVYTNETDSHKMFADTVVLNNIAAGNHAIALEAVYDATNCDTVSETDVHVCTSTDPQDKWNATVLELPR